LKDEKDLDKWRRERDAYLRKIKRKGGILPRK
jgi:hypothetical protein